MKPSFFLQSYGQARATDYFNAKESWIRFKAGLDLKRSHTLDDRK